MALQSSEPTDWLVRLHIHIIYYKSAQTVWFTRTPKGWDCAWIKFTFIRTKDKKNRRMCYCQSCLQSSPSASQKTRTSLRICKPLWKWSHTLQQCLSSLLTHPPDANLYLQQQRKTAIHFNTQQNKKQNNNHLIITLNVSKDPWHISVTTYKSVDLRGSLSNFTEWIGFAKVNHLLDPVRLKEKSLWDAF